MCDGKVDTEGMAVAVLVVVDGNDDADNDTVGVDDVNEDGDDDEYGVSDGVALGEFVHEAVGMSDGDVIVTKDGDIDVVRVGGGDVKEVGNDEGGYVMSSDGEADGEFVNVFDGTIDGGEAIVAKEGDSVGSEVGGMDDGLSLS